jgi:hypothetical protein
MEEGFMRKKKNIPNESLIQLGYEAIETAKKLSIPLKKKKKKTKSNVIHLWR